MRAELGTVELTPWAGVIQMMPETTQAASQAMIPTRGASEAPSSSGDVYTGGMVATVEANNTWIYVGAAAAAIVGAALLWRSSKKGRRS